MIKKIGIIGLMILLMVVGCGRKPDEELPARVGDLRVRCKIIDQADLPETFPVTVSVYSDTARTLLAGTKTFATVKDSVNTVAFTDLAVGFKYVHITVDVSSLVRTSCESDLPAPITLHSVYVTPIRVITVRPGYIECSDL